MTTTTTTITADELEKFTIAQRREILFYLYQLINDGERVSVVFNEGGDAILTVLLDILEDKNLLIFDWGGSEEVNRKLLRSERNFFVCAPQGIGNRFITGPVQAVTYKGHPAFATRLPEQYTRIQRREYFRLALPLVRRPPCLIPQDETSATLQLSVVDISIGGVAIELSVGKPGFEIGTVLQRARIELKGIGMLEVDLEVCDSCEVQRGSKTAVRLGCRFVKLSQAMENQLQRFITHIQRDDRMRLGS